MKRPPISRGSSMVSQATTHQQEDSFRYMEPRPRGVDVDGGDDLEIMETAGGAAYDEEEDEEEEEEVSAGAGSRGGGLGEKKRRLAAEQVRALERSFDVDNKLDPERKARIARDLGLHPRQVAVWFQNRRARWKTKQIERDFAALRARHDALRAECDSLRRDKDALAAEIRELRDRAEKHQMEVKLESGGSGEELELLLPVATTRTAAAAAVSVSVSVYNKDGSTDSDSSAVFNEEASASASASPCPYSGAGAAALEQQQQQQQLQAGFTGFTSFLAASSSSLSSSFFPSIYRGESHLDQEADGFFSAGAGAGAHGFFAEEQSTGIGSWYGVGGEGW